MYLVITLKFSQSAYSNNENNGPVQPVLILSGISLIEFTVQVLSIDESATGKITILQTALIEVDIDWVLGEGIDFISGPYTVKIPTNVKMVSFSIVITNDSLKENNETFRLVIDPYSLPNGVVVGTPDKPTITIVDTTKCKLIYSYSCLFTYVCTYVCITCISDACQLKYKIVIICS